MSKHPFERSRQLGQPFLFEIVKRGGKWRAREWVWYAPTEPWLRLLATKSFDDYEDALMESFDQRVRRRASQMIGFR